MSKSKQKGNKIAVFVIAFIAIAFAFTIFILSMNKGSDGSKIADSGLRYNYMHVDIVFGDDRTCHVKNSLEGEFLVNPTVYAPNHGLYVDIPVNSGEIIENVKVSATAYYSFDGGTRSPYEIEFENMFKIVRVRVGDGNRSFYTGGRLAVTVEYDYTFPRHKLGNDVLAVMGIGNGWASDIAEAVVSVTYPAAPEIIDGEYGVYVGGYYIFDGDDECDISWSDDGKTVTVTPKNGLKAFEGVELAYKMPDGTVGIPGMSLPIIIILATGGALLIAAVLIKIFVMKSKRITPVVEFYPPRIDDGKGGKKEMLPVQMGKIIDDSCSKEDVTSLVFYWASKGYLQIDEREDDTYFIKLKNVAAVRDYEKNMFNKLFAGAKENEDGKKEVSLGSLSGKFANTVSATKAAVNREYKNKFYTASSVTALIATIVCLAFAVVSGMLLTITIAPGMLNVSAIACAIPVIISYVLGSLTAKFFYKFTDKKRALILTGYTVLTALITLAASMLVPTCVMGWAARIPFVVIVTGISCVAPFLIKRKDEYVEQLNSILGFRNFLRDAEKEKLELLLAEDPQYYYDILPYANVLGVSEIWSKKFDGLAVEPPTYIRSYRRFTFLDYYIFRRIARSVGGGLTYVEPKVNSGSFSSGGGSHGGGGGGFSGGSFGGGGGGRW